MRKYADMRIAKKGRMASASHNVTKGDALGVKKVGAGGVKKGGP